jgi:hypothetical protein
VKITGRILNLAEPIRVAYTAIMTSNVRFDILAVGTVKISGFWFVMPYSLIDIYDLFLLGTCCLYLQDEGSKFLWNIYIYLPDYTVYNLREM